MEIKILKSLEQTNAELWNSILSSDKIVCTYEHLLAVEKSHINDCDYRYIMIFNDHRLLAHTCMYAMSFDLDIFNKGTSKKIIDFIRAYFLKDFLRMKIIECGCPTALGSTISMVMDAPKKKILTIICKKMDEYAREKNIKILLLRDFYKEELNIYNFLQLHKFKCIQNLPNSIIVNRWKTFDQYLWDLTAHYRGRIRRYLRSLENNDVQVIEVKQFSTHAERLHELWFETFNRAKEYQREILTPDYFKNIDVNLGTRSKVILFKKDNIIIGFILVLTDDETLRPLFVGMDYRFVRRTNLYFNLLSYVIKMVINEKKRFLEIGITSIYHKKEFGAEIIPLYGYMIHLNPILNMIVPKLFNLFSPQHTVITKHVFNRRFFERIYTDFKIRFWHKGQEQQAQVHDISESGIRLASLVHLKKRNSITVEFHFPETINSFMIQAQVVWSRKQDSGYEIGLMFGKIHQPVLDRMKDFLKYLMNLRYG